MINWDNFYVFAAVSICLWLAGAVFALRSSSKSKVAIVFTSGGIIILGIFIAGLWIFLQRPPLRTMGETRLWYSFFMGIAGLLTYIRWKYRWILSFSTLLSTVFVIINLMKPEIHDQSLMPALQSVWFIPHVTVYMFSYSVLGCAFIIALTGLFRHKEEYLHTADNLVYAGVAFLSIGMLLGSLWAKEAWGNYWSWDPKETWAAITWMGYLLYIHLRLFRRTGRKTLYALLIVSFLALQMCWYGVNYLPAAQQSVHLYNRNNYTPDTNFKGWMYTIMRNIFINNYRKVVRDQTFVDQTDNLYHLSLPQESGLDSTESRYDLKEMHRIVNSLPKEYKVPFSMHVSGFKYREIAEKLDLPLGTVKSRIFFTRQRLQEELKDFRQ